MKNEQYKNILIHYVLHLDLKKLASFVFQQDKDQNTFWFFFPVN
jgi:hypothetical protein